MVVVKLMRQAMCPLAVGRILVIHGEKTRLAANGGRNEGFRVYLCMPTPSFLHPDSGAAEA